MGTHEPSKREKLIICGLFLSKFDRTGLEYMGFSSFLEAYNVLGYGLQSKHMNIKNYRDEIDPYFPNPRTGWKSREMRSHCRDVIAMYGGQDLATLGNLVRSFVLPESRIEMIPAVREVLSKHVDINESTFAKRAITGQSAERYFETSFSSMPEFHDCTLTDTTSFGCGFDFEMTHQPSGGFLAVEVKGLREKRGSILITELEYEMADLLGSEFYLVVVRNFSETPFHTVFQDPIRNGLKLKKTERLTSEIQWSANIA